MEGLAGRINTISRPRARKIVVREEGLSSVERALYSYEQSSEITISRNYW